MSTKIKKYDTITKKEVEMVWVLFGLMVICWLMINEGD